jgi:hypothetical protein
MDEDQMSGQLSGNSQEPGEFAFPSQGGLWTNPTSLTSASNTSIATPEGDGDKWKSLRYVSVEKHVRESQKSGSWDTTMRYLFNGIASLELLSQGFLNDHPKPNGCPISSQEILDTYKLITEECPQSILNCVYSATTCLLDKLKMGHDIIHEGNVGIFLIILQNPSLMDPNYHTSVLLKMCDVLGNLSLPLKQILQQYIAESVMATKDYLTKLVAVFQHFITMRMLANPYGYAPSPNKDEPTTNATKCLGILCNDMATFAFL